MENIYSKSEDVMWLAQQLKNKLNQYVSFNKFGISNPVLTGVYCKNRSHAPYYSHEDVRFFIKFCKGEFLRIQISKGCNTNKDIVNAMDALINTLSVIDIENKPIGFPLAIYETEEDLTSEYAFKNIKETIKALKEGTFFDDGSISNLLFTKNCDNCNFGSYGLDCTTGKETLYCTIYNGVDTETLPDDTCEEHIMIDGEIPNIKVLCQQKIKI